MVMLARKLPLASDVVVYDHGSVAAFDAKSARAADWFAANLPEDVLRIGRHWAVDRPFAGGVIRGLRADGLAVHECIVGQRA